MSAARTLTDADVAAIAERVADVLERRSMARKPAPKVPEASETDRALARRLAARHGFVTREGR